jgi:1-deoxy-D-xylulose-5-phosphate synthase
LAQLDLPADLRSMELDELDELATDIRDYLVSVLSETGGHLSPNLGVVELSIALHRTFDSPKDAIIWDVGHQAYVHKILTGRADRFPALRKDGGLSGYPSQAESEHDWVENSHASTSLSYAMGMATAPRDGWTVAVIGDGALTGGMAYEALNHIAQAMPDKLIVIINDNGRSYAPTVGGLAKHLSNLRIDHRYETTKKAIGSGLRHLPWVGEQADETARRLKESVKQILAGATFFDVLELKYTGPIDGHDIALLEHTLEQAKEIHEPVVIHVVTEKGRGYAPAIEDEKEKLHGVGKFDIETGAPTLRQLSYTDVFAAALAQAAEDHDDVVAVTAAMESSTGLSTMAARHPDRVHDVGISEQHAVTFAAGLAMAGKRPVVCIYSSFLQRAFDQVMLDVAMHRLPVTFVLDRAGVTGPDGASHHGVFDLSYLRMIPGMAVATPASEAELGGLLEAALDHDGPVAIRFPKGSAAAIPELPVEPLPFGEWEVVTQGDDVLVLAAGKMVEAAAHAGPRLPRAGVPGGAPPPPAPPRLAEDDVACTVVNARWIKPMDPRLVEWAATHDLVVTVEDNVRTGGFGSAVLETLAPHGLAGRVRNLAVPDQFLRFGNQGRILEELGLDADSIAATIAQLHSEG